MRKYPKTAIGVFMALCLATTNLLAGSLKVPAPEPADTCPVCGMFVARYPEWVATLVYMDGHAHHFDGAKDLFKYLLDLPKYAPDHSAEEIAAIAVTDYYNLDKIDARDAFYVMGSDVLGPMGHELVPHASEADARGFMADHGGTSVLRFDEVTVQTIKRLDR